MVLTASNTGPSEVGKQTPKERCEATGGFWDENLKVCLPSKPIEGTGKTTGSFNETKGGFTSNEGKFFPTTNPDFVPPKEVDESSVFNADGTVTVTRGGLTKVLSQEEFRILKDVPQEQKGGSLTSDVQEVQAVGNLEQRRAGELAGQVGQIDPTTGLTPTDISQTEALTVGVRDAVPRALTLAGTAIAAGFIAAPATGGTSAVLGVVGGAILFAGTIASSVLNNMKGQRSDTTTAQQRTLDEGKQTLQDWSTQAAANPALKSQYLRQFNVQLQLIQDAHVQMLTDTNADILKFETALPNLAEFDSFYSVGGERDALVADMQTSLLGAQDPMIIDFRMIELARRTVPERQKETAPQGFIDSLIP